MAAGKEFRVIHACTRQVRKYHTERYGQQQQRLILLDNGQIEQHTGYDQHDDETPILHKARETHALHKVQQRLADLNIGICRLLCGRRHGDRTVLLRRGRTPRLHGKADCRHSQQHKQVFLNVLHL